MSDTSVGGDTRVFGRTPLIPPDTETQPERSRSA
jgi:hypothetical protein